MGSIRHLCVYLNMQKNRKRKEYDDCELIFEDEYLNGVKNGKGKNIKVVNLYLNEIFELKKI